MDVKDFKKYLNKPIVALIDWQTKETVSTVLKFDKETKTYITECGYVVIDIITD